MEMGVKHFCHSSVISNLIIAFFLRRFFVSRPLTFNGRIALPNRLSFARIVAWNRLKNAANILHNLSAAPEGQRENDYQQITRTLETYNNLIVPFRVSAFRRDVPGSTFINSKKYCNFLYFERLRRWRARNIPGVETQDVRRGPGVPMERE